MAKFKQYKRIQIAEMRPVTKKEIELGILMDKKLEVKISVSVIDVKNGSPKIGDMVLRNPDNHNFQKLITEQYFKDNFEEV